jgi:hypothetical protein
MANENQRVEAAERQLLRDIQKLASREFVYEDLWRGMVPFDGKLTELQTGPPVPFAELSWSEQVDVLREFIHWDRYPERGWDDEYRIQENIATGKRPEQWLEGTSLRESFRLLAEGKTPPPPREFPEITQKDLASLWDALAITGPDGSAPNATDGKVSLRDLQENERLQDREKLPEGMRGAKASDDMLREGRQMPEEDLSQEDDSLLELYGHDTLASLFEEIRADEAAAKREDAHGYGYGKVKMVGAQEGVTLSGRHEDGLHDALAMAEADRSPAKAVVGKHSLQDLRNGSQEQERQGEGQRGKPREMER